MPSAVWSEISRHRPSALVPGLTFRQISAASVLPPDLDALARALNLHEGEREALCVVREHQAGLLLTDDAAARLAARNLGIPAHGTIGVLFRAIRRGRKTGPEIAALLRSLPAVSSLHVRRSLLAEFIQQAEQVS